MKKTINSALLVGFSALLWLASTWWVVNLQHLQAADPTTKKASLPEVAQDEDEFYAHVDRVDSPTELTVTVLDVWNPLDKRYGLRWPAGIAKVKPTKRAIILEDISVPDSAEQRKRALDFVQKTLEESGNEVICSGSSVSVKKQPGGDVICVTGYLSVKKGFTLNAALVRQGLATTTNPSLKPHQPSQKGSGIRSGQQ
jgi:hypothetical protein